MGKVSIIVPVFNSEKYISQCIESIIEQTYKNIEIIIINDGSTDSSPSICEEYAQKDTRIKLIHIENSGVSTARNLGIENSTGDFITFVDSDDWLEPKMIELAVKNLKETDSDISVWSYFKNFENNKEIPLPMLYDEDQIFTNNKDDLYLKSINSTYKQSPKRHSVSAGTTWCKLYKRELITAHNLRFNKLLTRAQDTVFTMKAYYKAKKVVYFNENLYHYRITNTQISSGNRYIHDTITPFNELLKELESFKDKVSDKRSFEEVFMVRVIGVLLWHLDHKYFHKEYKASIFKKRKSIIEIMNKEPYSRALKEVDITKLGKRAKLAVILFQKNMVLLFVLISRLNSLVRNR